MSTPVSHSMLVQRALAFLEESLALKPGASLATLLDEAGARFNLSPADAQSLEHAFRRLDPALGHTKANPAGASKDGETA